jgi:hypothetical protein
MPRPPHITEFNASVITLKDGSGLRYLTDIQMDASHGVPFSWHREDAVLFRKQGVADELLPRLRKAWPTAHIKLELVTRRELR